MCAPSARSGSRSCLLSSPSISDALCFTPISSASEKLKSALPTNSSLASPCMRAALQRYFQTTAFVTSAAARCISSQQHAFLHQTLPLPAWQPLRSQGVLNTGGALPGMRVISHMVSAVRQLTWLHSSSELCEAAVSMSCEPERSPLHSCAKTLRALGSSAMIGRPPGSASDILLRRLTVLHGVGLPFSCRSPQIVASSHTPKT